MNAQGRVLLAYGAHATSARPQDPNCREFTLAMPEAAIELLTVYQELKVRREGETARADSTIASRPCKSMRWC